MPSKEVRTEELKSALLQLRTSFLPWDNERRKKVDIVLMALNSNTDIVDLNDIHQRIDRLIEQDKGFHELAPAAKKMLRIHYLDLSQSDEERTDNFARMNRARDKLKDFEERGML